MTIFLDSAGSSLPPDVVLAEMTGHLQAEAQVGGYKAAEARADDLADGYRVFGDLLDCEPGQIAFTDSASRSWLSLLDAVPLGPGDRVLITQVEYGGNAVALFRLAEQRGFTVEQLPSDETGQVDVAAAQDMLDERVKLVSVVHIPTNSGLISPVAEIAKAAHEVGALVLLDACQSVGHIPVRMGELGVDMLSGTGRKWLRGPRGTGFLAVRADAPLWPRLFDHTGADMVGTTGYQLRPGAQPFELYEYSVAARLGLIAAARYALDIGMDTIGAQVCERGRLLRTALAAIPGVSTHDPGRERSGIVTFSVAGVPAEQVRDILWEQGIVVTGGRGPAARIDMTARGITEFVRASPHYFVTEQQLDQAVDAVRAIAAGH